MRRILLGLPLACVLLGFTPPAAQATTIHYAADGERCTIVGTNHADVLTGTSHHDVICGLGGDDVIKGGAGNDTIDGGSGNDVLYGGTGDDILIGGPGNDRLYGDAGNDHLYGGSGKNTLSGGSGRNVLSATGSGAPATSGSGVGSKPSGGATCSAQATVARALCTPDNSAPVIVGETHTPSTVDVSTADQEVTFQVHATDDTGVTELSGYGYGLVPESGGFAGRAYGQLTSGTSKDGIWTLTMRAARGTAARTGDFTLAASDAVGHSTPKYFMYGITFVDSNPDTTAPVMSDAKFSASKVDVQSGGAAVLVTARITDAESGVDAGSLPFAYLHPPDAGGKFSTSTTAVLGIWQQVSGDDRDGVYNAYFSIPQGTVGGEWTLSSRIADRAGNSMDYFGPDGYAYGQRMSWTEQLIPAGTLNVTGSAPTGPPSILDATVEQAKVDVCPNGAEVDVDVHVLGADSAAQFNVDANNAADPSVAAADVYSPAGDRATLISGTPADGVWRVALDLLSTTPISRFAVYQVSVTDRGQTVGYGPAAGSFTVVPPGSPTS